MSSTKPPHQATVADPAFDQLISSFGEVERYIKEILQTAGTKTCFVTMGTMHNTLNTSYQATESGTVERVAKSNENLVFAIPSILDIFIAVAAVQLVEEGDWKKSFKQVFNKYSNIKIGDLPGDPSVISIVCHYNGVADINDLLFAPEGSPLLSKNDFIEIIPRYMESVTSHDSEPTVQYSSGNVILMALLIEAIAEMRLDQILNKYIFTPFGMNHTYVISTDSSIPLDRARPHSVSSNGHREGIHTNTYLADTIEAASAGGWSSAKDLAIFYRTLLLLLEESKIDNEFLFRPRKKMLSVNKFFHQKRKESNPPPKFDKTVIDNMLTGMSSFEGRNGYAKLGMSVCLNDDYKHVMGKRDDGKEIWAYYMAGSVTGSGYTVYLFPCQQIFIIILTDTTGPLDASDIISRLCIHQIFDLTGDRNYVKLSKEVFQKNAKIISKFETQDRLQDTNNPGLCGKYTNSNGQSLVVSNAENMEGNRVIMRASKDSGLMRLVQLKPNRFTICPAKDHSLSIDRYQAWKDLEFVAERADGIVTSLTRGGVDPYIRVKESAT